MYNIKIIKTIVILISMMTIVSCSFQKSTNNTEPTKNYINDSYKNETPSVVNNNVDDEIQYFKIHNIIHFNLNKHDIPTEFIDLLTKTANFLSKNPKCKITIEGHTDERGSTKYNKILGEKRAKTIKCFLEKRGVSSQQISIVSYGKEKPLLFDHNENSYSKNRRAVLIYHL